MVTSIVVESFVWVTVYWATYFPTRILANKSRAFFSVPFLLNILLGVYIFIVVQPAMLSRVNYRSTVVGWLGLVMALALITHHLSAIIHVRYKRLARVHEKMSHLAFFVTYGLSSVMISLALWQRSTSQVDLWGVTLYLLVTELFATGGVLVGLAKVKLWYT